eukprot:Skav201375  [mRNA]  locus=scaffold3514:16585:17217:- [translate_table: standard]
MWIQRQLREKTCKIEDALAQLYLENPLEAREEGPPLDLYWWFWFISWGSRWPVFLHKFDQHTERVRAMLEQLDPQIFAKPEKPPSIFRTVLGWILAIYFWHVYLPLKLLLKTPAKQVMIRCGNCFKLVMIWNLRILADILTLRLSPLLEFYWYTTKLEHMLNRPRIREVIEAAPPLPAQEPERQFIYVALYKHMAKVEQIIHQLPESGEG